MTVLHMESCETLTNIPNSICELKHLKSLCLHNCERLRNLPHELGNMENLEELLLGSSNLYYFECLPIKIHFFTSLWCLRRLDLNGRGIDEEDFPKNFHAFSSLEELYLNGNHHLTCLPEGISNISSLKLLEVSDCWRLQNLHGLPSQIQALKARNCISLEKIEDISEEFEWLFKIWLFDCPYNFLQDQENERYLDKMLQQSFLKKCAAVDHRVSIGIPRSTVPSWFKEILHGCNIVLKLPPTCHKKIKGFAICGVFDGEWHSQHTYPRIIFKIVNDETIVHKLQFDSFYVTSVSAPGNLWLSYMPFSFFQKMYHDIQPEDWIHIEGNLVMTIMRTDGNKSVRRGAQIIYKEDVKSIGQNNTCISDFGNMVQVDGDDYMKILDSNTRVCGSTYMYEEKYKYDDKQVFTRHGSSARSIRDKEIVVLHTCSAKGERKAC